jgi:hypothetical protein
MVRAVGDPAARFAEDYLRILRGIRFAARLGFTIDPATWEAARTAAPGLAQLSAERVRDEWFRSLETARSLARLVVLWHDAGAARVVLPELLSTYPLALEAPPRRDPVLLTATLCRDPNGVVERLRCSGAEVDRVRGLVGNPAAPAGDSPVAVRRWLAQVGSAASDLIAAHELRIGAPPPWARVVAEIHARGDPLRRGDLAASGTDLAAIGVAPGPEMGRILAELLELVLVDPDLNQREVLLERARALAGGGGRDESGRTA